MDKSIPKLLFLVLKTKSLCRSTLMVAKNVPWYVYAAGGALTLGTIMAVVAYRAPPTPQL